MRPGIRARTEGEAINTASSAPASGSKIRLSVPRYARSWPALAHRVPSRIADATMPAPAIAPTAITRRRGRLTTRAASPSRSGQTR